eukprot:2726753-Alexandrium_andersonii.AAC.1
MACARRVGARDLSSDSARGPCGSTALRGVAPLLARSRSDEGPPRPRRADGAARITPLSGGRGRRG